MRQLACYDFSFRGRILYPLVSAFLLFPLAGCEESQPAAWGLRDEVLELPAVQRDEIAQLLAAVHGSYEDPRIRIVDEEATEALQEAREDAEDAESDGADSEDDAAADVEAADVETLVAYKDLVDPQRLIRGRELFGQYCAGCHGVSGDGMGPAGEYLYPPPRDYRPGVFKFTSTPDNFKPRREDIELVIRRGAKGTSMPAFRWLPKQDVAALTDYVILLSRRGELELSLLNYILEEGFEEEDFKDPDTLAEFRESAFELLARIDERWNDAEDAIVMPEVPEPPRTEETILAGQSLFLDKKQNCYSCHGADARGGIEDDTLSKDAWGQPAIAANLTTGMYHGGGRPIDLYRRIHSGITTRMPAFGTALADDPEQIWHLVHFVQAVGEGREITAEPTGLEDEAASDGAAGDEAASDGAAGDEVPEDSDS
ncbi:MAG: hypothetical protein DWQ35_04640 [Planctomycetota bacterium]|nr:MAG: hypothetical protein DWQ35_04640 [Planctomycetota bacterium]REK25131.1 MAG: hypothetical protein DWQ42_12230 [Planctomycetota bacterium]REK40523.1 MAG: hypothetical protein DWQ46_16160 [Planctomycetota bacterium]